MERALAYAGHRTFAKEKSRSVVTPPRKKPIKECEFATLSELTTERKRMSLSGRVIESSPAKRKEGKMMCQLTRSADDTLQQK